MLALRPIPEACEPREVRRVRAALREAPNHPDASEIDRVCDILSHAILRLREIVPQIADASVASAISDQPHGTLSNLEDSLSDIAYAVDCWREQNIDARLAASYRETYP